MDLENKVLVKEIICFKIKYRLCNSNMKTIKYHSLTEAINEYIRLKNNEWITYLDLIQESRLIIK